MLVSHVGSWMQFTALGYYIDDLTREPIYLGLLGLSQAVPRLLFAFLGGVLADRVDRRRLLLITNGVLMASAAVLTALAFSGRLQVWHILSISAFNSLANSFDMPARQSMVPLLVGEGQLISAVSLNTMAFNGSGIFGPSVAGVIVAAAGVPACFLVNTLSYTAVIAALVAIRVPSTRAGGHAPVSRDIAEGIGLLARHRHLLAVLGMVAVMNFFGRPYIRLMPALAREALGVGPTGLGLLQAAPALGTVAAVFVIGAIGQTSAKGRLLAGAATATGAAVLLFAMSPLFVLSLALLVLVGTSQAVAMAAANTVLQTSVQPEQRGRIMGIYGMVTFGMLTLGTLPMGALAGAIGVAPSLGLGGIVVMLCVGLIVATSPRLIRPDPRPVPPA